MDDVSQILDLMGRHPRAFECVTEGHYRLTVDGLGIVLDVDRLRRDRHDLVGELTVLLDACPARTIDGVLQVGTFNLSSPSMRTQRAKQLREESDSEVDFRALLEELCQRVIRAERRGSPSAPLHTFARPRADRQFDLDGLSLLRDHPTILFGDGGAAKSYLALHAAGRIAQRGTAVLFADWELSGTDHRDRLERLFGAEMPTVHYMRCDRPMIDEADRIGREVRRLGVGFLVLDSIGFAIGGRPEEAEHANAYFRSVRQIGVGSLHLAHVTKAEGSEMKPFGSAFFHNAARSTWFVKPAATTHDGQRLIVTLIHRKANLGRLEPTVGFQFDFDATRTHVSRVNLAEVTGLEDSLPLWQRITHVLTGGPLTILEIATALGAKVDTVTKAVTRGHAFFTKVTNTPDGIHRIALVERRMGGLDIVSTTASDMSGGPIGQTGHSP